MVDRPYYSRTYPIKNTKRKQGSKSRNSTGQARRLSDGPSYRGQQRTTLKLEGISQLLSTTITTGLIAGTYLVEAADIASFATRFGNTFDEYRILGADITVTPITASTGVSRFWFDEKSSATPTFNDSRERTVVTLPNSNANARSCRKMTWRARDLLDLQYTSIATTSVNPVTFKIYTDNGNYGAPATVTQLWLVESELMLEFRGIASS